MNQPEKIQLIVTSRQKIEPAYQLFVAHMASSWEISLQAALKERKAVDLDYEIERKKSLLIDAFYDVVDRIFEQTLRSETSDEKQARGASVISAVGFDHIELAMAISQLEALLKIRFNRLYTLLEKRNKALFYFANIDIKSMPFGLSNVTQLLKELFLAVELNEANQMKLMQCFSDVLSNTADELYQNLNRTYAEAGILPHLEDGFESIVKSVQKDTTIPSSKNKPVIEHISNAETVVESKSNLKSKAKAKPVNVNAESHQSVTQAEGFELTDDLMKALFKQVEATNGYKNPENNAKERSNQVSIGQLIHLIKKVNIPPSVRLNSAGVGELKGAMLELAVTDFEMSAPLFPPFAEKSMDVLGVLAEDILIDNDLDDRVVHVLNRLVKPLLTCLIQDPGFFNQADHPIRQFLDHLLQAGSDWFGCELLNELFVFEGMINEGSWTQSAVFESANKDLSAWLTIAHESAMKKFQKVQAESAGKDRLRMTRLVVDQYITQYVEANPVAFVKQYFQGVLADALSMAMLQHGEDSRAWRRLKILARDIHMLTLPNDYNVSFSEENGFNITKKACQLMVALNYQAADILNTESNFGSYMAWMNAAQDAQSFQDKKLIQSSRDAVDAVDHKGLEGCELTVIEEKFYHKLLNFTQGTVLDFLYEDDQNRRKVLCWQNKEIDVVVLTDPTGGRTNKMNIKRIAKEMAEGVVVVIDTAERGYFERIIKHTMKRMNNHTQKAG